jgi:hypothetical protein
MTVEYLNGCRCVKSIQPQTNNFFFNHASSFGLQNKTPMVTKSQEHSMQAVLVKQMVL